MLFRNTSHSTFWMRGPPRRFTGFPPGIAPEEISLANLRAIHILHNASGKGFSLPIVSNTLRGQLFRETVFPGAAGERPCIRHFRSVNKSRGYYTRLQGLARIKSYR